MKFLMTSFLLLGSSCLAFSAQEVKTDTKSESLESLKNAVTGSHIIKNHIPGNPQALSSEFKKFLCNPLYKFQEDPMIINAIFTPDGTKVFIITADNSVYLWDPLTGSFIKTFMHEGLNRGIFSTSKDGMKNLTSSNNPATVHLWNLAQGGLIHTLEHDDQVHKAHFSECATKIFTISGNASMQTVTVWDAITGRIINTLLHNHSVNSAVFSPDTTKLLTRSFNSPAVLLWDITSGNLQHTLQDDQAVFQMFFSYDGNHILTVSSGSTKLWNGTTGRLVTTMHSFTVFDVYRGPDSFLILSLADITIPHLDVWDILSGTLINTFKSDQLIGAAQFSPSGSHARIVPIGALTNEIWDVTTGDLVVSFPKHHSDDTLKFSPNGKHILFHSPTACIIKLIDIATLKTVHTTRILGVIHDNVFSPDSSQIVTRFNNILELWDPNKFALQEFLSHLNLNQTELLQAFELAIRERSRIHIYNDNAGSQIQETFKTFPISFQRKLQSFMAHEVKPKPEMSSSSSTEQIL